MKLLTLFAFTAGLFAQSAADPWKPLEFLIGDWAAADSAGEPGKASSGAFSFKFDLEKKVLIRRNVADYPGGLHHEDLMVIYPGSPMRATYWDNEGHVIPYKVSAVAAGVVFLSDASTTEPRYRLSYRATGERTANLTFEIAPPGQPEAFKQYVTATVVKKESRK